MSLRALKQVVGLTPSAGLPSSVQNVPSTPPTVEASAANAVTPSPSPPLVVPLQEATPVVAKVSVLAALVGSVVTPPSTVITPLLSVGVATTSAPVVSPPSFLALPSSSSRPRVFLDYLYTSSDADSLWGASYKPEQKTPTSFVSSFDKNLIRSAGVHNATDYLFREVSQS